MKAKQLFNYLLVLIIMMMVPIELFAWGAAAIKCVKTNWDFDDFTTGGMTINSDGNFSYSLDLSDISADFYFKFAAEYLGEISPSSGSNTDIVLGTTYEAKGATAYASFKIDQAASAYKTYTVNLVFNRDDNGTKYWDVTVVGDQLKVPTVTISPNGGYFDSSQTVTLSSSNGENVYYTTDGTNPTSSSSFVASGSTINVTATSTVTAGVLDNGNIVGITSATFTKRETTAVYIGGCIGGSNLSWDLKTYSMTYDSTEGAYYYDISATDFNNWQRTGGIGLDFRFVETYGEIDYNVTSVGDANDANTTLTNEYQALNARSDGAGERYVGFTEVSDATSYRVWYKVENGTRYAKVVATLPAPPNLAGYYIYGKKYDGVNPTKLHYKMLPVTGSNNEYYIDLLADDKTLAGVNLYSTGNDISDTEANDDTSHSTYWADMNNSTFYVAHVPTDNAAYNSYGWNNDSYFYGLFNNNATQGTNRELYSGKKGWQIQNNGGMYRFIITVDSNGVPASWRYESHPNEIVIYKVSAASNWTTDTYLYCTRRADANKQGNYHGYNQKFFGTANFTQDGEFVFLLGDKWFKRSKNNSTVTYTKNTSLADVEAPNLVFQYATGTYGVMFNPTQDEYQLVGASTSSTTTPISIWIAGNAVSTAELTGTYSNWTTTNSIQLTYDEQEACWKATIPFYTNKYMRFLNNNNKSTNWGEDEYAPTADGTCANGDTQLHNHVNYNYSASTGTNINFLKPSGTYTVRFYMKAAEGEEFTSMPEYWYTLTLESLSSEPGIMLVPDGQTDESHYTLRHESGIAYYNYNVGDNSIEINSILENATQYMFVCGYDLTAVNSATISEGPKTGSDSPALFRNMQYTESGANWVFQYKDSEGSSWTTDASGTNKGYIFVKVQALDENEALAGNVKIYRYVFDAYNVLNPTVTITPTEGFYINKVTVTARNEKPSLGMKWKGGYATEAAAHAASYMDDGMQAIELNEGTGSFSLSTPGYVAVVDELGSVAVGNFDFTYSTSENYVNYYHNGSMAQSVSQAGGKDATNIFVQYDDRYTLSIYAWNHTLDDELRAQQDIDHPGWYHQLSGGVLEIDETTGQPKIYDQEERPGADYYPYKDTTVGTHERDPYVKLTPDYPGTLLTNNRTFEIDGVKYFYLSLPYERLRDPSEVIGFIITQADANTSTADADLKKTWDYYSTGNKSFIYTSTGDNVWSGGYITTYNNILVDISSAIGGENAVFFRKPSGWGSNLYCHVYTNSGAPYEWKSNEEKMGLIKTDDVNGDLYGFNIPVTSADGTVSIIFYDYENSSTNRFQTDGTYTSGRKTYTIDGLSTEEHGIDSDYTLFLETPGTTTVEVTNYPNGKDYVDHVSYDKTILLDPTWDGKIPNPLTDDTKEETGIACWNGTTGAELGYRKMVTEEITQRIVGLDPSKTYTVQAIVRGWGEEGAKLKLKVGEGTAQEIDFVNASAKSYVNKNGRVDDRYTEGPDPDDPNIMHNADFGWIKIEASGTPTAAGNLDITLTPTFGATQKYDLADVVLLEDANTNGKYWTKLPTDATSTAAIAAGELDMTDNTKYNAFSFFDRNEGNPNAIIKANNRTVIGLNSGIADTENGKDAIDHRQSRNTISLNEDGTTWSGRYLYLYDESSIKSDCNAYGPTVDFTMIGAKYDRQFTTGNRSTIFLPYAIPTSQLKAAGFTQLSNINSISSVNSEIVLNTWDLTKETLTDYTTIAGNGYIVTAGNISGKSYASLEAFYKPEDGISVQKASSGQTSETTGLVGNYVYTVKYQNEGDYMNYSFQNNQFRPLKTEAQGGATMKPFRAILAVPTSAAVSMFKTSFFYIEDDYVPTDIQTIDMSGEKGGNIYTIDGRLVRTDGSVNSLPRGIYIQNNKKFVVK